MLGTEMPYMCSVSNDTNGVDLSSGIHVEKSENVQCGDVMGRACSSVGTSSRGSCSSRVRKSRVKVQLARLVLCHEKERLRESSERATREKERQLEMAEAELEAWKAESVCSVSRRSQTTRGSFDDVMPTAVSQPILELSSDKQTQRGVGLPTS